LGERIIQRVAVPNHGTPPDGRPQFAPPRWGRFFGQRKTRRLGRAGSRCRFSDKFDEKAFISSHVSQMLSTLAEVGLVYKNRHGKYSLVVPLLGQFIQRQSSSDLMLKALE
jgi:hypothetical protein